MLVIALDDSPLKLRACVANLAAPEVSEETIHFLSRRNDGSGRVLSWMKF